jgi:hypothetical protein
MKLSSKIASITSVLALSVAPLAFTAAPAQASGAPGQKLCASGANLSTWQMEIIDKNDVTHLLSPGECRYDDYGTAYVKIGADLDHYPAQSFRVGYNGEPYQGCQNAPKSFTPSTVPYQIYFKIYRKDGCVN